MPYRKYRKRSFTRIQEDTFRNFIKLGKEVMMGKHYTLWSTSSTRSKDDCSKFIALTLFKFFFNLAFVFNTPFLTYFHKLFIKQNFNTSSLSSINIFLLYVTFNRNNFAEGRKLVFKCNNFSHLSIVFYYTIFSFCNRKNFFKIIWSCITTTRNINCTNIHDSQINIKPFSTVI